MALLVLLLLFATSASVHVFGQTGFLNIDCGMDDMKSGYKDRDTGLFYVGDGTYTDAGENLRVSSEYEGVYQRPFLTVRSFPSGERNCYTLPTEAGAKYLVRFRIYYGNHDGKNNSKLIRFDLHIGANYWDTADASSFAPWYEAVFMAWASWAPVCLVNTGSGVPFASTLELRLLADKLYPPVTANEWMAMYNRANMGSNVAFTRFPSDGYDRFWWATTYPAWANSSTVETIAADPSFAEPWVVLQSAATPIGNNTILNYWWQEKKSASLFKVFVHFADFQNTRTRQFDIYFNGNRLSEKPYSPSYLAASCVYTSRWYRTPDGGYNNITLSATAASMLPPMLNALEVYTLISLESPTTYPKDFDVIMAIKIEYGVKKNWMGDPCFPVKYAWDGVKCSNTSDNTMRITSIDLSNSSLHGAISKNFTLLSALENLDLSYNNITGSIPDSLPSLPSLRVLNLSGNHLTGDSLCKNYSGSLVFRYDSDGLMCEKTVNASKGRAVVIAISVVVPVLVIVVLLVAYFIWREKAKPNVLLDLARESQLKNALGSGKGHGDYLKSEYRLFTYKELKKLTNNFKQFIGKGGFGVVYYGHLENGTEVAVKMRSDSSLHGLDEFIAEVQSLSKVHHRNLVSLVGYCWEKGHLALVYEYMSEGNLCDRLRGKNGVAETLNWETRLRIVLEAAQGLDYLHKGCSMPIVHRDLKTSNILLGNNLQAKISDFGLSKIYLSDTQTHISTTNLAGTAGYIDPEYQITGRLTKSCDVYSFGVVVLEVVTGQAPIMMGHGHIVQRVKKQIATRDISLVADARLGGAYDINSMWKVIETAIMCTEDSPAQRPTMSTVVVLLKESLELEEAREKGSSVRASPTTDTTALVSRGGSLA